MWPTSSTARPKPFSTFPIDTLAVMVTDPVESFFCAATNFTALPKHAEYPKAKSCSGLVPLPARAAQPFGQREREIERSVVGRDSTFAPRCRAANCRIKCVHDSSFRDWFRFLISLRNVWLRLTISSRDDPILQNKAAGMAAVRFSNRRAAGVR